VFESVSSGSLSPSTSTKRIFVTGASGCIGHYLAEALIQETHHELFFLVRNPDKLKFNYKARPRITILSADLREIEQFRDLLATMHCAVLAATSWGGTQEVFKINVDQTVQLVNLLNPAVCQQVIYFSTASVLDRNQELLKEAGEIGTDYIRSKYLCLQQLSQLALENKIPPIITLFPTLVFGGDAQKPQSHLSSGLPEVVNWIGLIRFFNVEGSFHFIHGRDIAQVVRYLIEHPSDPRQSQWLVLGNQPTTVNQGIAEICAYLDKKIYFRLPLSNWLINLVIVLFRIQMAAWDRFCLSDRHFTYQNSVSPATLGLSPYCPNLSDVLRVSGIPEKRSKASSATENPNHQKPPQLS
jgi:nucleoside-diphosphate-sugar epimerase